MNRADITISIASGALTALIVDTFIVGDISLNDANSWGKEKVDKLVIDTAKHLDKEGKVTDLLSAVRFLEEKYKIPSDSVENCFGGAKHHHLYDYSHHPTPVGWFFAVASQYTGYAYGTDKTGAYNPVRIEGKGLDVSSISDLKKLDFKAFLPFNNPLLNRMLLISSASFSTVDITAAGIKAAIKNPGSKFGFAKDFLLGINYVGVLRLNLAVLGVTVTPERLEKLYDDYAKLSEKIKDNKIVAVISEVPLGIVPSSQKVIKEIQDAISEYQDAKEERIRIQKECEENIQVLIEYRNEFETEVSAYLVDNLTVFNEAFDQMNEAILNNDSDAYIDANAKIQNQLGKDMQFHSQDEFDGLMGSDDDFKL